MEWHIEGGGAPGGGGGAGAFPGGDQNAGGRGGSGRGGRGGGGGGFPGGDQNAGGGRVQMDYAACATDSAKMCPGQPGGTVTRACLEMYKGMLSKPCVAALDASPMEPGDTPSCFRSPVCGNRIVGVNSALKGRVKWTPTLKYTPSQPWKAVITGTGGMVSIGMDSKENIWGLQRNGTGPQLFKFSPDGKLLITVGQDVTGHFVKAHGQKVDSHDNVWICDEASGIVEEINPEGKLIKTLGTRGHRGDWNEEKGQRLLWEPVNVDFSPNGDMFIFEGHANESPNDVDGPDPTNYVGAARVIHLDKDQNFINQWYGDAGGPGKFDSTHGSAVDPVTGLVWIGDREQYRIVQYTPDGHFVRTIQMKNLVCNIMFDRFGGVWSGTGLDGQMLKLDRDGNVIGAMGVSGNGDGSYGETGYAVMDHLGNFYNGDTTRGRITKWTPSNEVFTTVAPAAPGGRGGRGGN